MIFISMKVLAPCLSCNTTFESYQSQNRKFCSRDCQRAYLSTPEGKEYKSAKIVKGKKERGTHAVETRSCKQCSNEFSCLKSEPNQFCSPTCRYAHLSDNKDQMLEKQRATNKEKYGVDYHMQNHSLIERMKSTVMEKYGIVRNHPRYSEESRLKAVETCIAKYGKPYAPSFVKESKDEKELLNYIKEILPNEIIEENNRELLNGKEIDIYIPSKKIAIEYNGLYYHSESYIKDRKYHLKKTNKLAEKDIRLIHIFSDEWKLKRAIVERKLANILGVSNEAKIHARKCLIKEVPRQECSRFLNKNHIQGSDKSRVKLGLYHEGELVAVMTFAKGRQMMGQLPVEGLYELSRFATKSKVTGAGSKLLNYFKKHYNPSSIISYADKRWSVGDIYDKIGFKRVSESAPSYWYTTDYRTRLYRYNFRKGVLVANGAPKDKSEWEIMQSLGYDRVWDCGTIKYVFE